MPATAPHESPARLTLTDAASRGCFGGYSTLRKRIADGELSAERVGRRYLVRESDLEALVEPAVGRPTERAALDRAVDRIVSSAPRLTREQRAELSRLLSPAAA